MPEARDGFNTGIVSGSGALPFAVADSLLARGRMPIILGIRGFCDAERITRYRHHWIALGQLGRLTRLLRAERRHDVMFIGGLVRPALSEIRSPASAGSWRCTASAWSGSPTLRPTC